MQSPNFPREFPTLETDRLLLRELALSDVDAFFEIRSHPEVRHWTARRHESREQVRENIIKHATLFKAGDAIRWGIVLKENGRLVGSAGFWAWEKEHYRAEVGYELAKDCWGKGIMPEALTAIIPVGFGALGLHSIQARLDPANAGSVRVLEKLGFVREAWIKENYFFEGKFLDTLIYSLLNK